MGFAHLPFLPFLDSQATIPSQETLKLLNLITPILVSASIVTKLLSELPTSVECYIYDDLDLDHSARLDLIVRLLDQGSVKVVTHFGKDLIALGVPSHRIISPFSSDGSPSTQSVILQSPQPDTLNKFLDLVNLKMSRLLSWMITRTSNFIVSGSKQNLVHIIRSAELNAMDSNEISGWIILNICSRKFAILDTLGQVYSSLESIKLSIKTQRATYFSRSRNQIWVKGETSGATQECLRIRTDCDRDSLEFTLYNRLFTDEKLLKAKIMEEAEELCDAESPDDVTGEMADLLYFALCRVSLADVEKKLNQRSLKIIRRKGDAKPKWEAKINDIDTKPIVDTTSNPLRCQMIDLAEIPIEKRASLLKRPLTDSKTMTNLVTPIIEMVKLRGDQGLLEAVQKFDRYKERTPMVVETMKGVVCSRFADRLIAWVCTRGNSDPSLDGLDVSDPRSSSRIHPPRSDGTISAEIMYIASKCGVSEIVKAGGAHAIAALAYGTDRVSKVDKIFGPGNQFVTVAKMLVASDVQAATAIDMPAGPSEVLVIADHTSDPVFVAADLLSQAEHGIDSQVILLAVDLSSDAILQIEHQINLQALKLSRLEIIKQSIPKSFIVKVSTLNLAFELSNHYAPEHLILHIHNPNQFTPLIKNAGSVFIGAFSPESCGDYASGTNHSLPTVGFAKQYSGVSTMSFMKHITTQELTKQGLLALGPTVIRLANLEGLDGHANAVQVRLSNSSSSS
ncbi:hypothetical protein PSTT_13477, partial [Puccinia striiformis]